MHDDRTTVLNPPQTAIVHFVVVKDGEGVEVGYRVRVPKAATRPTVAVVGSTVEIKRSPTRFLERVRKALMLVLTGRLIQQGMWVSMALI